MGHFRQPHATLSEPATSPPTSRQGSILSRIASLMSSSVSHRVSSLKSSIKKGASAIACPIKKARQALTKSTTNVTTVNSHSLDGGDEAGPGDESLDDPIKQLGISFTIGRILFTETQRSETQMYLAAVCL